MASFIPKILSSSLSSQNTIVTKKHTVKRILAIPPKHLYDIILDVNKYKEFIPFCTNSQIIRHSDCGTMFDASLQIGFGTSSSSFGNNGLFQEEYVSRVTKMIRNGDNGDNGNENEREWIVTAHSIKSNLFHKLSSSWKLTEVKPKQGGGGMGESDQDLEIPNLISESELINRIKTNVEFEVEISVSDPIITLALDGSLGQVAKQQVAAFEKRCLDIPFQ